MTVTMPTWLLAITYAACICIGYAASWYGVVKVGTALLSRRNREADMPHRRTPWVPIIMLIAAAMVVTIGVMSGLYAHNFKQQQRDQRADQAAHDRCITRWGDDLVATINASRDARKAFDEASQMRADATADVLHAALGLTADPPQGTDDDVVRALRRAQRADERVRAAGIALGQTLSTNTYEPPTLACGK